MKIDEEICAKCLHPNFLSVVYLYEIYSSNFVVVAVVIEDVLNTPISQDFHRIYFAYLVFVLATILGCTYTLKGWLS